jgi:hypothetical protein
MSETPRAALVPIALPRLKEILCLPTDACIHSVSIDPRWPDAILLRVIHPSLPEHRIGQKLLEMQLVMHEPVVVVDGEAPLQTLRAVRRPSEFL